MVFWLMRNDCGRVFLGYVFLCCSLGPERVWPEGAVMIRERERRERGTRRHRCCAVASISAEPYHCFEISIFFFRTLGVHPPFFMVCVGTRILCLVNFCHPNKYIYNILGYFLIKLSFFCILMEWSTH